MIKLCAFSDEAASDIIGQIKALKKHNITLTEIRNISGKNVSAFTIEEAKEYQKQFSDNGIKVWSVGSPLGKVDITTDMNEYMKTVRHCLELANAFCTDKIRMFSFFNAYNQRERVMENLNKMVEVASEYGVKLYHENEKEIYGDTVERVIDILDNVKGIKSIYDPANYIQCNEKAEDSLKALHSRTDYYHIKDIIAKTDELVPAGYGDGKIKELVEKITDDKVLTIEPHLAVFEGYAGIDNTEMKNKFTFNSNEESFDFAVNAIKNIITKSGYVEKFNGYVKEIK